MSLPGWYPDPSGNSGHFRYWDGSTWSAQTTTTPGAPPGPAKQPRSRPGLVVAILALVAVLVIGVVIWRANSPGGVPGLGGGQDTNTAAPTVSAWDETTTASPTPNDEPSDTAGSVVACPDTDPGSGGKLVDGRMQSGGLSVPLIPGWAPASTVFYVQGLTDAIEQSLAITWTWKSDSAVAAASRDDFPTPSQAARSLMQCLASSGYYQGLTGTKELLNGEVTIDGHRGHRIRTEIYVDSAGPNIAGDVADIIVVDTGDPARLGVYLSAVTIGDSTNQAKVDAVIADIRVVT